MRASSWLLLGLLPWLGLLLVGVYALWQLGYLLGWLGLALVFAVAAWLGGRRRQAAPPAARPLFEPDRLWSPTAEAAWVRVEALAAALNPADYRLSDPAKLLPLARRIIGEVAQCFHPKARRAELDIALPSVLLIVERVSRDLRELLAEQVPGSHLITVGDGLALWRWKQNLQKIAAVAGVGRMLTNPVSGVLYELRTVFFGRAAEYPLEELERWLLHTLARKIGYYAILLYGGQLLLDDGCVADCPCPASERDLAAAAQGEAASAEPLRILIAGQTKAGKSSLVNALFGELRAPADALPLTSALTPYRLERDGELLGLVLDSPGYGDGDSWVEDARAELHLIDLVLLACAATQAGRAADARFLQTLRAHFQQTPDRAAPPLVVALTHIDLLRPLREWAPPYNIAEPQGAKERHIRLCMDDLSQTLAVPLPQIQALCLKPGVEWNVEALWTAIADALPQARRARYLRCLKDARAREKWGLLRRQLASTGRLIADGIGRVLPGK
ncbi:MAG: GTPase family protein [Candidatus Methylumidiphilus sp.]